MIEPPDPISAANEQMPVIVEKATLRRRFAANFIDSFIISIINQIISPLLGNFAGGPFWFFIVLAIPVFYFIYPYSTNGQTPGKRALDIKVVSIDGSPLNWRKGLLRSGFYPEHDPIRFRLFMGVVGQG